MPTDIEIDHASVKVMRSHDYCHFEVQLGTLSPATPEQIDELRKTAARLADKAVEQYKLAKANHTKIDQELENRRWEGDRVKDLEEIPETERTPEQQARIKAYRDAVFEANRRYDYEDHWHDDEDNWHGDPDDRFSQERE